MRGLESAGGLRRIPVAEFSRRHALADGHELLNLSSNDYLGIASDDALRAEFFAAATVAESPLRLTSSSSRLLSGNCHEADALENTLATLYGSEAALVFGSGYHANAGILPALAAADKNAEFFADKLVHASIIDGLRLSGAKFVRFRHNDLDDLARLLAAARAKNPDAPRIIVTESIFSMDGDCADLPRLAALKRADPCAMLYLDEAHAVGVRGANGLGLAEEAGVLADIDILIGTCGKALASTGAYAICGAVTREWLVNKMRTLIFTTAPAPINLAWTRFIIERLATPGFRAKRERLARRSEQIRAACAAAGRGTLSQSHIIPLMAGASAAATTLSAAFADSGFYALPVRPPTVPEGSARVRLSLNAAITDAECAALADFIRSLPFGSLKTGAE